MKGNRKTLYLILVFCLSIIVYFISQSYALYSNPSIDAIIRTDDYNYLPIEVQDFIVDYYNETGEILLTEKNKQVNYSYLNPRYVDYIISDNWEGLVPELKVFYYGEEENNNVDDNLPDTFIVGASYSDVSYNLSNDGYVTPVEDQFNSGLCWSFATNGVLETYLLKEGIKDSSNNPIILSKRQLDYATSIGSIKEYENPYKNRNLFSDGGNFTYASYVLVDGLGFVDKSWDDNYLDSFSDISSKEAYQVFNYEQSLYEVNSTTVISHSNDSLTSNEITRIKKNIINNGGVYVATDDPVGSCATRKNGIPFINNDGNCTSAGHAMLVVGWDDSLSSWILKNSWGSMEPVVYLYYYSKHVSFGYVTDIGERNWDDKYESIEATYDGALFTRDRLDSEPYEKLQKIKFYKDSLNSTTYNLYISFTGDPSDLEEIDSISVDNPGWYTFDISMYDLHFQGKDLLVKLIPSGSSNNYSRNRKDFRLYTLLDEEDIIYLNTNDSYYEQTVITNDPGYLIRVNGYIKGAPDMSNLEFILYDEDWNEIDPSLYSYSANYVFNSEFNVLFNLDQSLPKGIYNLESYYNDGEGYFESMIEIENSFVPMSGSGTQIDPYLISNPGQLNLIRLDRDAWYELTNDIDLTFDTQDSEGLFYNDGMGWEPIIYEGASSNTKGFSGVLDGNGYRIKGLYICRPDENYVGLFSMTYNHNYTFVSIHDLILEDVMVEGKNYVGSLVGYYYGTTYERDLSGFNLAVNGGLVYGIDNVGGLFGRGNIGSGLPEYIYTERNSFTRHYMNDIYVNVDVEAEGKNAGGIFGSLLSMDVAYNTAITPITIDRYEVAGLIKGNENAGGVAGNFEAYKQTSSLNLKNGIIYASIDAVNTSPVVATFNNDYLSRYDTNNGYIKINNLYYSGNTISSGSHYSLTNVYQKTYDELKEETYSNIVSFNTYWNKEAGLMPILKASGMENTKVYDIVIDGYEECLFDYITPDNMLGRNVEFNYDTDIFDISDDGWIYPYELGEADVNIYSNFDGFEGTIHVDVKRLLVFTITFNSNGGEGSMPDQELSEEDSINPNLFTKEGYRFLGWATKETSTEPIYMDEDLIYIEDNITLYAIWAPDYYIIKFFSNGGEGEMLDQQAQPTDYLSPNLFTKDKYQFNSWNTDPNGNGLSFTDAEYVEFTGNLNLYAQWERVEFVVTFDSNLGSGEMEPQTIYSADNLVANTFTKNKYKFICWNTNSDGSGTRYNDKEYIIFNPTDDDITLYAMWVQTVYTVTFNSNTGTGTMNSQDIDEKGNLSKNLFTKDKYEFTYWSTNSDGSGTKYNDQDLIEVSNDITLYANWKQTAFEVTYNSNTGTGSMSKQTIDKSGNLSKNLFTKDKFEFLYWTTNSNGTGTKYNDQELINITSDITLYANWKQTAFDVTFDSNTGTGSMSKQTIDKSGNLNENKFTKDKYEFLCWTTNSNGTGTSYDDRALINVTSDITLYAKWNRIEYNVEFLSNTGTGTMNNQTIIRTDLLNENKFTKTGYIFSKWCTNSNGTGTCYNDRQNVTPTVDLTLYAIWERSNNTVIFNPNGGTGNMGNQTVKGETKLNKNLFTRTKYEFKYWSTDSSDNGIRYLDESYIDILDESIILYAIWEKVGFDITFDSNLGAGTMNVQTITRTGNINENKFTRDRYEFIKWNTNKDGTGTSYNDKASISLTDDITLYAIWEKVGFDITFDSNSGTGTMSKQLITKTGNINENKFTKNRYEFIKWNTKYDGTGTSYNDKASISLTDDITLYAIWEKVAFEVTFSSNTGLGTMKNQLITKTGTLNKNTYTKEGYVFKEWNTSYLGDSNKYEDESSITLTDDIELFAIWEPISYTISFKSNGGNGTMSNQVVKYDQKVKLSKNLYTMENKVFIGWRYDGKVYSDEEEIINLTNISKTIELTAIFDDEITYEVKYEVKDNIISNLDEKVTIDNYKNGFIIGPNYKLVIYDHNNVLKESGYIGTGFKTEIHKNNELIKSYLNVVNGDINSDGTITPVDYAKIKNHIMEYSILTSVYLKAADYNHDDKVTPVDYAKIKNYILGGN